MRSWASAILDGRRAVDPKAVKRLADSISKIGLRQPITVRDKNDRYILVAGLHRIEAYKKLGKEHIMACIVTMTNDNARLWEIAENLHRSELSNLERAECIEEWRAITDKERNRSAPVGGIQPSDAAYRKTAEALGVSEKTVRNSNIISKISDAAKEAAIESGVDKVRDLIEVANQPKELQPATVHALAAKRASAHPKDTHERAMEWRRSFERVWNQSTSIEDREWARAWIDNPIMNERYGS